MFLSLLLLPKPAPKPIAPESQKSPAALIEAINTNTSARISQETAAPYSGEIVKPKVEISVDPKPITASELMKKIQYEQKRTQSPEQKANVMLINSKATAIDAINQAIKANGATKLTPNEKELLM